MTNFCSFIAGVKTSKDCRAGLHNGLWFYKFMLMLGLSIAVFFIPDPHDYFIKCKSKHFRTRSEINS